MTNTAPAHARGLRGMAESTLRWLTAFDPFGPYAPRIRRR